MQQIESNIYYEDAFLGVTLGALIFNHGVIMIDAPLRPEDTRTWRSALTNQRGGANRLLVSLDAHPDRTLGTRTLECTIVAHQKAAQVFRNRPMIFKGQTIETGSAWETYNEAVGMRWAPPDITFSDRMSLHWGGPEVSLEWRPGPTSGSIWAVIPSAKVVFAGDSVIVGQPPFLGQADLPQWVESLDMMLAEYKDWKIVTGRGGLAAPNDIQNLRSLLLEIAQHIEDLGSKNAPPEATADLAPALLERYTTPAKLRDYYLARLRFGLQQAFIRRFRPAAVVGPVEVEEEEQ
jgi:glyoxylase-like metal-dependent hydrolase (beta-lactamase superfamily II)